MSEEVGVTEHVFLVDHKAQECEVRVVNFKCHLLLSWSPDRAEAIVIWKEIKTGYPQGKAVSAASALNLCMNL